ncbi:hydroxyisourate hydrolase [Deinococcus peraridilitoris]|uniref:hydroxyisourate hydrolase n=1 Tax=Deinococcus peraridilitoris TaxID=432329 RepID=UPI001FE1FDE4|nr:hydroxyisourate hydrolase [Deinococcus peraridilitoris]
MLDTARGVPAAGVKIELYAVIDEQRSWLKTVVTNADGRTDEPLIFGGSLETGQYELVFHVGDYFGEQGGLAGRTTVPFLNQVPVRFGVADQSGHYHVPLLVSPWSYSTYRGS